MIIRTFLLICESINAAHQQRIYFGPTILLLFSAVFLVGCGTTSIKKSEIGILKITISTISKDVKENGGFSEPIGVTRQFTPSDEQVVSHVGFIHLSGRHQIRWEWYTPSGDLYQSTGDYPLEARNGRYNKEGATSHSITLNRYQNHKIETLDNAVNDAKAVSQMLKRMGFEVRELYNTRATKKNIHQTIAAIRRHIRRNDSFCFYFAGHGQGISLKSNDREGYIIPYDADIDLRGGDIMQYDTAAISLSRLQRYLEDTRAKHISLLLDSCFSGLAMRRAAAPRLPDDMTREYYQDLLARKAINILTAGDDHPVIDGIAHSPFTQAILNGLDRGNLDINDRDGFVTFNQLAQYVKEKVEKKTSRKQRPQFDNLSMDDGDFIFKLPPPE